MNKDQIKGKAKEAAGEVQEHVGRAAGSPEQEARGHVLEQKGKLQQKAGDLKEVLRKSGKH